jgi:hypothetical protein
MPLVGAAGWLSLPQRADVTTLLAVPTIKSHWLPGVCTVVLDDELIARVRGEFLEMPGLKLTTAQAQRLWSLDLRVCERLINGLLETQFLERTSDGSFVRRGGA